MFGSQVLEVALGLIFIYYLLSLFCTTVNELIARFFSLRSTTLIRGIRALVADAEMARVVRPSRRSAERLLAEAPITKGLYEHPLIRGLMEQRGRDQRKAYPSFIPADVFARALLHTLDEQLVPRFTLRDGLARTWAWLLSQPA